MLHTLTPPPPQPQPQPPQIEIPVWSHVNLETPKSNNTQNNNNNHNNINNQNDMNDNEEDDALTLVPTDDGSDTETCSTHTAPVSDLEPADSNDGAAHNSQGPQRTTGVVGKPPRSSKTSTFVVPLTHGEILITPKGSAGGEEDNNKEEENNAVNFPIIFASWEALGMMPPSPVVHHRLRPLTGEAWAAASVTESVALSVGVLPPRITCVYQVGRSDIPHVLRSTSEQSMHKCISRVHVVVRLHFQLTQAFPNEEEEENKTSTRQSNYKLTSFDLLDSSSSNGTFYHTVRLFPSHRYSFPVKDDDLTHVELRLGDYYKFIIHIGNNPLLLQKEAGTLCNPEKSIEKIDIGIQCVTLSNAEVITVSPGHPPRTVKTKQTAITSAPGYGNSISSSRIHSSRSATFSARSNKGKSRRKQINFGEEKEEKLPYIISNQNNSDTTETAAGIPTAEDDKMTIVTTGIRLSRAKAKKLRSMNIVVNPPMSDFSRAEVLVIDGPLIRSVKLMTALPFVRQLVHRTWLDAVLASSLQSVDTAAYRYAEPRTHSSIESVNEFSLTELMQIPRERRQSLFAGFIFWVHPQSQPQESPDNDLRFVILASGGVLTRQAGEATIAVMPRVDMTKTMWRHAAECPQEPQCIFVIPSDVFRGVLQQRRLVESTVRRPRGNSVLPPRLSTTTREGNEELGSKRQQMQIETPSKKTKRNRR
ncbi:hypothetical protein LSM04_004372 [Trypanosoma melophagium]|uniref:uncharacterized protein n=1 Tax=Trypanosoma melophagium TaxID=715481 RepID=UPI00351A8D48|nr:hypothetical protein LSM04_004372 [Trypanosoma melophagium]